MNTFLTSNEAKYRLARTILQGIIGIVIANIDLIMGQVILDPAQRAVVVALVMAILSPIMAALGQSSLYNSTEGGLKNDGQ
jgi:multisubunit Na+/H+ antiporter MnhG subunit